jgi:hypothetical protein
MSYCSKKFEVFVSYPCSPVLSVVKISCLSFLFRRRLCRAVPLPHDPEIPLDLHYPCTGLTNPPYPGCINRAFMRSKRARGFIRDYALRSNGPFGSCPASHAIIWFSTSRDNFCSFRSWSPGRPASRRCCTACLTCGRFCYRWQPYGQPANGGDWGLAYVHECRFGGIRFG